MADSQIVTLLCWIIGYPSENAFLVEISKTELVVSLIEAILEKTNNRFKDVDPFTLSLWKVSIAYDTPDRKAKLGEIKCPEEVDGSEELKPWNKLAIFFPDPPKAEEIHIIVCHPDYAICRSFTSPSLSSRPAKRENPKTQAQLKALLDELFESCRTKLDNYVSGPAWSKFWTAPPTVQPEIANFINELQIPLVGDDPTLLLHGIGDGIVDERTINNLFNGKNRFLANVSGSGMTRLLIEGLNKNWGFYFTSVQNSVTPLGSRDIMFAIDNDIPNSAGFSCNLLPEKVFSKDDFQEDIFYQLSSILKDTSDDSLNLSDRLVQTKIEQLQNRFGLGENFYFVLDEAQYGGEELEEAFHDQNESIKCPSLRLIISAWSDAASFPVIVSGTSLSIKFAKGVRGSHAAVVERFASKTGATGAFDTPEGQRHYILRYIPKCITNSENGRVLLGRAWNLLRGRHCFTAFFVVLLVVSAFRSPHRLLDKYVMAISNCKPTDGEEFTCEEQAVEERPIKPDSLNFDQVRNDAEQLQLLSNILLTWTMRRGSIVLRRRKRDFVESGFARFVDDRGERALVNEPLVLLAATSEFDKVSATFFADNMKCHFHQEPTRGERYGNVLAFHLANVFGANVRLCNIFNFRGSVPRWAEQTAELVSVTWDKDGVRPRPFSLQDDVPPFIGRDCSTVKETVEWFRNPLTILCLPDEYMGPDIVMFIRLAGGQILCVIVQAKWLDEAFLSGRGLADAAALDPSQFYDRGNMNADTGLKARTNILQYIRDLGEVGPGIEAGAFFSDGLPLLRVVASYPAVVHEVLPPGYVTLDMDYCQEAVDGRGVLEAMDHLEKLEITSKDPCQTKLRNASGAVFSTIRTDETGSNPIKSYTDAYGGVVATGTTNSAGNNLFQDGRGQKFKWKGLKQDQSLQVYLFLYADDDAPSELIAEYKLPVKGRPRDDLDAKPASIVLSELMIDVLILILYFMINMKEFS
ncbi:hypothetical protein EW145_g1243 [Phellinidium pouzarii]|uniref:Crinkler effector protein N-terminal domain-containing protein n=1 Tax=Phellinidium pouzarii TaxID=167371 RepID=A0A4S4LGZ6_9AGAM|nr:hypothetical protein EW145_g1243 [Phellinidium pouzarii]